jgi:hypothetical protein
MRVNISAGVRPTVSDERRDLGCGASTGPFKKRPSLLTMARSPCPREGGRDYPEARLFRVASSAVKLNGLATQAAAPMSRATTVV